MTKLLPCPFCGTANVKLRKRRAILGAQDDPRYRENPQAEVNCLDCGAAGPLIIAETGDAVSPGAIAAAIFAWNTREGGHG